MDADRLKRISRLERINMYLHAALCDSEAEGIKRDDPFSVAGLIDDAMDALTVYRRQNNLTSNVDVSTKA